MPKTTACKTKRKESDRRVHVHPVLLILHVVVGVRDTEDDKSQFLALSARIHTENLGCQFSRRAFPTIRK